MAYINNNSRSIKVLVFWLIGWNVSVDLLIALEPLHAVDGVAAEVVATHQRHLLALVDPHGPGYVYHLDAEVTCKCLLSFTSLSVHLFKLKVHYSGSLLT